MQSSSGLSSSRASSVVTAIAIVLALIGVVGVAAGAADKPDDDRIASVGSDGTTTTFGDASTTLVPGDAASGTTAPGGRTGTTSRGGSATTSAGPTPTTVTAACPLPPATSADPGAHTPPAVGTYTYASCTDSADTQDTKVGAGSSGNGVTRRTMGTNTQGFEQQATLAYGASGVLLESLTIASPQGDLTCDWNPDVVNYPATLRVGTEWNTKSSCDLKDAKGASPGKLNLDATGKVSGKVAYNVAGTTVNAWVIDATIKLTTNVAFGTSTITIITKSYYDPAHGMDVFRHSEARSQQGNQTRDERLVSLTPKP